MSYQSDCIEAEGLRLLNRLWCKLTPDCTFNTPWGRAAHEARNIVNSLYKFGYPSLAAQTRATVPANTGAVCRLSNLSTAA